MALLLCFSLACGVSARFAQPVLDISEVSSPLPQSWPMVGTARRISRPCEQKCDAGVGNPRRLLATLLFKRVGSLPFSGFVSSQVGRDALRLKHGQLPTSDRRLVLFTLLGLPCMEPRSAVARVPGSDKVADSIQQLKDAQVALKALDDGWAGYACIDGKGQACNIDAARKILGGVGPYSIFDDYLDSGKPAETADKTPLYGLLGGLDVIRKYARDASPDDWGSELDLASFGDISNEVNADIKLADAMFFQASQLAGKPDQTEQLIQLYNDAKDAVDRTALNIPALLKLLSEAKAPGT